MFELAGSGLAWLAATPAGQALLRAAGVVVAPEVVAAGAAVYLGYQGVQYLINQGVLSPLPGFSPPPAPSSPPPLTPPQAPDQQGGFAPSPPVGQPGEGGFTVAPPIPGINQTNMEDAGRPTPIPPPVTPDGLLPDSPTPEARSGSLDALAGEIAEGTKNRLVSVPGSPDASLDADHLGAAAQEYEKGQPVSDPNTGKAIISSTTGKPVDHVQEVDAAATGLEKDIDRLQRKIIHNQTFVDPPPSGSIADAQHLLDKMKELDAFVRNIIPKGVKAPWSQ